MLPRWMELLIDAAKECVAAGSRGDRAAVLVGPILTGLWSMLERGAACEPSLIALGDCAIKQAKAAQDGLRGQN